VGRECVVGIASRGSNPGEGENLRTNPDGPRGLPDSYTVEKSFFAGSKAIGVWP
jgi:hypothetical protein